MLFDRQDCFFVREQNIPSCRISDYYRYVDEFTCYYVVCDICCWIQMDILSFILMEIYKAKLFNSECFEICILHLDIFCTNCEFMMHATIIYRCLCRSVIFYVSVHYRNGF